VQRDSSLGDRYTYDLTQQILGYQQNGAVNLGTGTVTNPQTNTMLTFDGCGNRTSMNGGGTYVANNLNQYTTFNGSAVTSDSTGNLQTWNGVSYAYDAQNRLTNVGAATNFVYDPKNRVVVRSVNGTITFNVWDDWELVEEYAPGNVIAAKYLQGAHGPVKSLLNNVYYYQDSLGSTSHIASSSGALLEYYKYDLYGKPTYWAANGTQLTNGSNNGVRDLFSGERWVSEISMYDLRNRFYSPDLGRFLQPDPIGSKGDASNLYRYCGNDWANRTDPMGLDGDANKQGLQNMPNQAIVPPGCNTTVNGWGKITIWVGGQNPLQTAPSAIHNEPTKGGDNPQVDSGPVPNPNLKSSVHVRYDGETPIDNSQTKAEIKAKYPNSAGAATTANYPDPTVTMRNGKPMITQPVTATKHLPKDVTQTEYNRFNAIEAKAVKCIRDSVGDAGIEMQNRIRNISDPQLARNRVMQEIPGIMISTSLECKIRADVMGGNSYPEANRP
jgi:RHS repeat-associated protein